MIGLVLAAGTGRRLWPHTAGLPKALVPLDDAGLTPLDVILANFAAVGVEDVAVVVGYAADAVRERRQAFERRYGVTLDLIDNDRATTWNNCYSLWCARETVRRSRRPALQRRHCAPGVCRGESPQERH